MAHHATLPDALPTTATGAGAALCVLACFSSLTWCALQVFGLLIRATVAVGGA